MHWFWFPLLAVAGIAARLQAGELLDSACYTTLGNLLFLGVQLLLVTAYFSVKNKRLTNITAGMLGWGDILLLMSVAFYCSVLNFMVFYLLSLLLIVMGWALYRSLAQKPNPHIPLAGLQALLLAGCIALGWLLPALNLANDNTLIRFIA